MGQEDRPRQQAVVGYIGDPAFRTKLKMGSELVGLAMRRTIPFRAVVATTDPEELPDRARRGTCPPTWLIPTPSALRKRMLSPLPTFQK